MMRRKKGEMEEERIKNKGCKEGRKGGRKKERKKVGKKYRRKSQTKLRILRLGMKEDKIKRWKDKKSENLFGLEILEFFEITHQPGNS